jgi:ribosome-associated protein
MKTPDEEDARTIIASTMPRPLQQRPRPLSDGEHEPHLDDPPPSKTALKRQAHELQSLGLALAQLSDNQLAAAPMPESLREAIEMYRRTKSHEGRRRQLQYVGKLMRTADREPLEEAVAAAKVPSARMTLMLHRAERWREELVAGDEALTRWMAEHPDTEAQQLRALVRNARKDTAMPPEQRHGKAWRELFQFIKPWVIHDDV